MIKHHNNKRRVKSLFAGTYKSFDGPLKSSHSKDPLINSNAEALIPPDTNQLIRSAVYFVTI